MGGGAASGKVGAMVAAHNSGGQYVRARTTPTNPNSVQQQEVRNAVRSLSARWSTILTQDQRDGWETYAANVALTNRLGDTIHVSGIAMYTRSNVPRQQAVLPIIDDAPGTFDLGEVQGTVIIASFVEPDEGTITLNTTADWITGATGSENSMLLYLSRPVGPAIQFFKGPYRYVTFIDSQQATTGLWSFALPFNVQSGLGQQIYGYVRVSRGDGRLSSKFDVVNSVS